MQLKIRVGIRQCRLGRCIHEFYHISMVIILFQRYRYFISQALN